MLTVNSRKMIPPQGRRRGIIFIGFLTIWWLGAAASVSCRARTLTPATIGIVINGNQPNSWAIGKYYARLRGIPKANFIVLNLPVHQETISAAIYRVRIARAIRQILKMRHLRNKINCLVTTWGIPLRVGPDSGGAHAAAALVVIRFELGKCLQSLHAGTARLNAVGTTAPTGSPPPSVPGQNGDPTPAAVANALNVFQQALQAASERIGRLNPNRRAGAGKALFAILQKYVGPGGLLQMIHVNPKAPDADATQAMLKTNRLVLKHNMQRYRELLLADESWRNLAAMRKIQRQSYGVTGLTRELISEQASLTAHRGNSALDSDLMMLWRGRLSRANWYLNPMDINNWNPQDTRACHPRVMLVCRLDAPTVAMVKRMIRVSVRVEKTGLRGVAYFDARGLHNASPYEPFDHDLRVTARYLKAHSTMKVVLDDTPGFLQAKNCPDEAIYCGWYSLQHYLNSCQWLPGSVAYHVASFELSTLHNPGSPDWCPNLIAHGVCGTLGATDEPYLFSFPLPSEFFPLLLCGKFTQGEVFYMTTPVMGWRQAFVGDPLYNPFKRDPYMKVRTLMKNPVLARAFLEFPPTKKPVNGDAAAR